MNIRSRLKALERKIPDQTPEPLVVAVVRRIVRPSPDGPVEVGRVTTRYVDGLLVARTGMEEVGRNATQKEWTRA